MKQKPSSNILLLVSLCLVVSSWLTTKAQTKEEAAIIEVMTGKSKTFFDGNQKGWKNFWIQDSKSSRTVIRRDEFSNQIGWQSLATKVDEDGKEIGSIQATVKIENAHIRISENMAFAEADEHLKFEQQEYNPNQLAHTFTLLLKKDNVWKIANQVRVASAAFAKTPQNREYDLNTIGYDLLNEKRIDEATQIFIVNVQLNPTSWNAYDSLGEVYALSGNTKLAIVNYEKSLELNPKNEVGRKNLERLKKQ